MQLKSPCPASDQDKPLKSQSSRPKHPWSVYFLSLFFVIILGGCSFKSLFLNHGEWFIEKTVSNYFDLDDRQAEYLKTQLSSHWRWLLVDKRLQFTTDLESFRTMVTNGIKKSDVDFLRSRISFWRTTLYNRLGPDTSRLLYEIRSEQVAHLKEKLDDWDKKWESMLAEKDDADFRAELLDYHKDNFKRWYGSISETQLQQLAEIMPNSRAYALEVMKQSRGSRAEFLKLISIPKSTEQISQGLRQFVISPRLFRSPDLRDAYDKMTEEFWSNYAKRDAIATPEQRAFAAEVIQSFIDEWRSAASGLTEKK
jgi:hypothetical protein